MMKAKDKGIKTWRLGYDKSKQKAKNIYSDIGWIRCNALGNERVAFTRVGFNHLMRKGRKARTRTEQKRRFVLIQFVEQIITDPNAIIEYRRYNVKEVRNHHGEKVTIRSIADFWTFVAHIKGCKIKVVIRQLEGAEKHFFSVMSNDVVSSNTNKNRIKKTRL